MRGSLTLVVALTLPGVAGCSPPQGGHPVVTSSRPSATLPCSPSGAVDLDAVAFDSAPRQAIELSGGSYRLTATGFPHGGLLDPPVGRTIVTWGSLDRLPTYDPGPANIPQRVGQADLVEGVPAVVALPAGRLWLLNSNGVQIRLEACAPATVSAASWPR